MAREGGRRKEAEDKRRGGKGARGQGTVQTDAHVTAPIPWEKQGERMFLRHGSEVEYEDSYIRDCNTNIHTPKK